MNEFFVSFVANLRFEGYVAFFTLKCFLVHCYKGRPFKAFNKLICEIENPKNERILKGTSGVHYSNDYLIFSFEKYQNRSKLIFFSQPPFLYLFCPNTSGSCNRKSCMRMCVHYHSPSSLFKGQLSPFCLPLLKSILA